MMNTIYAVLIAILVCAVPSLSRAADEPLNLSWDANTESDLAGYRVYCSWAPGQYGAPVAEVGAVTEWSGMIAQAAAARARYCVLTAFNLAGAESRFSHEVSKMIAALPALAAPQNFTATTANGKTTFSWDAVVGAAGYMLRVHKMGTPSTPCESMIFCGSVDPATSKSLAMLPGDYDAWVHSAISTSQFSEPVKIKFTVVDQLPPAPKGLKISSATPDEIVIAALKEDCTNVTTSTSGSTKTMQKRTLRCVK